MILVDTAVWIDHLRGRDPQLTSLLERGQVLGHAWITGEIALGNLRDRNSVLRLLGQLPQGVIATPAELLDLMQRHRLHGLGIGYVDVQLLASVKLTDDALLWTRDRRLHAAADQLGVAYGAE